MAYIMLLGTAYNARYFEIYLLQNGMIMNLTVYLESPQNILNLMVLACLPLKNSRIYLPQNGMIVNFQGAGMLKETTLKNIGLEYFVGSQEKG